MSLERRCARLARAYPDPARRAEVATTLLEASAGRRRPRPGDALNVLWHGAAARAGRRTSGGEGSGRWRDALALATVQAVLMQAAVAAALAVRAYERPANDYPVYPLLPRYGADGPMFYSRAEAYAAVLAALVAVATAAAAWRGRVRLARAGALVAAAGGLGAVVASRLTGNDQTFTTPAGAAVALVGGLTVALLLGTRAVARAADAAPHWWWPAGGAAALAVAAVTVATAPAYGQGGRADTVVVAYAAQAGLLLVLALPLARRQGAVAAGAALVAVTAVVAFVASLEWQHSGELARWALELALLAAGAAAVNPRRGRRRAGRGRRPATAGRP